MNEKKKKCDKSISNQYQNQKNKQNEEKKILCYNLMIITNVRLVFSFNYIQNIMFSFYLS